MTDEEVEVHGRADRVHNAPGLMPSEMKRLKQLEEENSRLKRIVADLSLDKEMLQDVIHRKL